jgi:hypothetical protein
MTRTFHELASANVAEMSDDEIKSLIAECHETRRNFLGSVGPNVNSLTQQLEFARLELSARQSDRVAKRSIQIAILAILLNMFQVGWQIVDYALARETAKAAPTKTIPTGSSGDSTSLNADRPKGAATITPTLS